MVMARLDLQNAGALLLVDLRRAIDVMCRASGERARIALQHMPMTPHAVHSAPPVLCLGRGPGHLSGANARTVGPDRRIRPPRGICFALRRASGAQQLCPRRGLNPYWQFLAYAGFGAAIEIAQLLMDVGRAAERGGLGK